MPASARFHLATPHPGPSGAAISIIHLEADTPAALEQTLTSIGLSGIPVGTVALRRIAGIDTGLVARWSETVAHLMPHGGPIIISSIRERLELAGATATACPEGQAVRSRYPESTDLIEACVLDAISRAASPLAIDVILNQREAWRRGAPFVTDDEARAINHLLTPPTVVLLGPPNIGKSTLTNALAHRQVSIVADEPGTTRDHVGVMLELEGLAVRWIDAPGINPHTSDPIERAAIELALDAARRADLVLLCADATHEPIEFHSPGTLTLRLGLRADLGPPRGPSCNITISAPTGQGLPELASAIREALVPAPLQSACSRWRFHRGLPTDVEVLSRVARGEGPTTK